MVVGCGSLGMPRLAEQVEGGPLSGQRGRLQAAGGVSRTLCRQLPWFLVESLSAGCWRWREGACGLRDAVGEAVLRQQPEPKCCLTAACSALWGARSVHCRVCAGSCSARLCWDRLGLLQTGGPWRLAAFGERRRSAERGCCWASGPKPGPWQGWGGMAGVLGVMPVFLGARRVLEQRQVCRLVDCRDSWNPPYVFLLMVSAHKAADAAETC